MGERSEVAQGIKIGLQIAPATEGVYDAVQFLAVSAGGLGSISLQWTRMTNSLAGLQDTRSLGLLLSDV